MKRFCLPGLAVMAAVPFLAHAHTHLEGAVPADRSTIASSPPSISLTFSEPTRVTALTLQKGNETSEQKLGPLPGTAEKQLSVQPPKLEPGAYTVKWRAVGEDSHVMSGVLRFTVSAAAAKP
jgi:methionine-rich copper-binding protein CopC